MEQSRTTPQGGESCGVERLGAVVDHTVKPGLRQVNNIVSSPVADETNHPAYVLSSMSDWLLEEGYTASGVGQVSADSVHLAQRLAMLCLMHMTGCPVPFVTVSPSDVPACRMVCAACMVMDPPIVSIAMMGSTTSAMPVRSPHGDRLIEGTCANSPVPRTAQFNARAFNAKLRQMAAIGGKGDVNAERLAGIADSQPSTDSRQEPWARSLDVLRYGR